jgi:hypothetical protein
MIKSGGLVYARLDIRRSEYCNTVWTRAVNLTGTAGGGYAPAQSITTDEKISVYNCPNLVCLIRSNTEVGDVLPATGTSGWSLQLVLPSPGSQGSPAAAQPPTVRGKVTVHLSGGAAFSLDTMLEPVWTHMYNWGFSNAFSARDGSKVLSCDNSIDQYDNKCGWWGEPGGASATLLYYLAPSLDALGATVDVKADIRDVLLPAWTQKTARSPIMQSCTSISCEAGVQIVADTASYFGAGTTTLAESSGRPAVFYVLRIAVGKASYNHECGTIDDGCITTVHDDRILISHEIGHTLGLGHCDLNYSVMCHVIGSKNNDFAEGTSFWTPQSREIMGLKVIYP